MKRRSRPDHKTARARSHHPSFDRYPGARAFHSYDDFIPSAYADRSHLFDKTRYVEPDLEDDLRIFHPDPVRSPSTFSGRPARIVVGKTRKSPAKASNRAVAAFWGPTHRVAFDDPLRTILCRRRSVRRQVLHALGFTGRGSGGRGRRSFFSEVMCG